MVIEQLISPLVPVVMPSDTGTRALNLMEEANITQIPLVSDDKYLALVQENDLLDWGTSDRPLSMADFLNYRPAVVASGHPYEAMRVAHSQNLMVLPVVDNDNTYLGSITREELLRYITENSGLDNPGGIIVLEMKAHDYSLAQIARICEQDDTNVISTQLITNHVTGLLELTIKTNRTELTGLASSFERYKYTVKELYSGQSSVDDTMERYKMLMNYINM
jgi:acetoin utilization protein AcuB